MLMNNLSFRQSMQGFTLIQIVMVLVVVGILSVMALPKWTAQSLDVNYEARRVLNDIRYVQALSLTYGQRYRWVKTAAASYQILNQAGTAIVLSNGGTTLTLSSGNTFGTLT